MMMLNMSSILSSDVPTSRKPSLIFQAEAVAPPGLLQLPQLPEPIPGHAVTVWGQVSLLQTV